MYLRGTFFKKAFYAFKFNLYITEQIKNEKKRKNIFEEPF